MRWRRKMVNVTGGLELGLRGNLSVTVCCFVFFGLLCCV